MRKAKWYISNSAGLDCFESWGCNKKGAPILQLDPCEQTLAPAGSPSDFSGALHERMQLQDGDHKRKNQGQIVPFSLSPCFHRSKEQLWGKPILFPILHFSQGHQRVLGRASVIPVTIPSTPWPDGSTGWATELRVLFLFLLSEWHLNLSKLSQP